MQRKLRQGGCKEDLLKTTSNPSPLLEHTKDRKTTALTQREICGLDTKGTADLSLSEKLLLKLTETPDEMEDCRWNGLLSGGWYWQHRTPNKKSDTARLAADHALSDFSAIIHWQRRILRELAYESRKYQPGDDELATYRTHPVNVPITDEALRGELQKSNILTPPLFELFRNVIIQEEPKCWHGHNHNTSKIARRITLFLCAIVLDRKTHDDEIRKKAFSVLCSNVKYYLHSRSILPWFGYKVEDELRGYGKKLTFSKKLQMAARDLVDRTSRWVDNSLLSLPAIERHILELIPIAARPPIETMIPTDTTPEEFRKHLQRNHKYFKTGINEDPPDPLLMKKYMTMIDYREVD
ncbi:hypothetical protein KKD40_01595, partial [Candidatus Micrarchaeota archaeon]|nr:hypothetical protein [Candidatus Micrarchaeota archaeon]